MFRMSTKVVLCNSVILDTSGGFLLMMLLYLWPMLLLVVGWITVTHFSGVSLSSIFVKLQCIQNSAARIISNTTRYTSITAVLKKLHWLPVEHHSSATLVYKFLHTGFPKYFAPYISSYNSSYSTRHSQSGGNFLFIPKFQPSVPKSIKQFSYSFAFDAPTVWNALPEEIRASSSLASFRKRLKTYLYTKAYPP